MGHSGCPRPRADVVRRVHWLPPPVILAPRAGAVLGIAVLWVPFVGIVTKFWIGLAGARYTVCTGEGMIDMMSPHTPPPKNWALWPVFLGQLASGAISTAAIANAAGIFAHYFIPVIPSRGLGWAITLAVIVMVWSGRFSLLKTAMSILVLIHHHRGFRCRSLNLARVGSNPRRRFRITGAGCSGLGTPTVKDVAESPWREILPLLGWAAPPHLPARFGIRTGFWERVTAWRTVAATANPLRQRPSRQSIPSRPSDCEVGAG